MADARADLLKRLARASERFHTSGENDEGTPNDQVAAADAVDAVLRYLREIGAPPELWDPLLALHGALADLVAGRRNTLLRQPKKGGRPRAAIADDAQMATAAAVMTLCMGAGASRKEAAKSVAQALGRRRDWQMFMHWRDEVAQGRKPDDVCGLYKRLIATYGELDPGEWARIGLAALPSLFIQKS